MRRVEYQDSLIIMRCEPVASQTYVRGPKKIRGKQTSAIQNVRLWEQLGRVANSPTTKSTLGGGWRALGCNHVSRGGRQNERGLVHPHVGHFSRTKVGSSPKRLTRIETVNERCREKLGGERASGNERKAARGVRWLSGPLEYVQQANLCDRVLNVVAACGSSVHHRTLAR